MNYNGLISVVIPTYNRADTIVRCLDSVVNQTYSNIEIIVVDDCSTDNTEEIVKNYDDNRIIYHRLDQNRRACYARNYGCSIARGDLIAFQDSDDVWHSDKLEKEIVLLEKEQVDFVFCGMNRISGTSSFYFPTQKAIDTSHDFFKQELYWNAVSTQTILMRKEVYESVQFDIDFRKYQDWDFAIRVAQKFRVSYLPEALVDSYIQNNSVSVNIKHYEALSKIYEKYHSFIQEDLCLDAWYQMLFGDCFRKNDSKEAAVFYKASLKKHFKMRTFLKLIISVMGVHR